MQGVNVVARPLDSNGNPLYQYTVTAVTGALFSGNHGNPVTGFTDSDGNPLSMWGSNRPIPARLLRSQRHPAPARRHFGQLPGHLRSHRSALHPRRLRRPLHPRPGRPFRHASAPSPSPISLRAARKPSPSPRPTRLSLDSTTPSALKLSRAPCPRAVCGAGRLSQVGQSDWFTFPVRGNRIFTVVTQALDESGAPSNSKAMPSIGVWDAFDPIGATAVGAAPGLNGQATGETWLRVATNGDDIVRIGIADLRGDGRPDYAYNGWVLYADTVSPARLPASGGPITIQGMGFRLADTVLIGGQPALVTSISPNQITAIAPPAAPGVTGSVDVEVDDQPVFYAAAIIPGGISYDSGTGDALTLVTAPTGTVPIGEPIPFTVTALGSNLTPAGGVTVIYTVTSGTATLACGLPVCSVVATGDGRATMNVTANGSTWSIVTASLTNGSSLQAQFAGGTPPVLSALTPQLSLAAGATFTWTVQALVLSNGIPLAGQSVAWQTSSGSGISAQGSAAALTNIQRHRHQNPHRRPARRRPNRHHQRLPQRNQPVRRLHRLRRAP